uniref:Uncharacterized protein n=1 Tax=Chromera velia CCMP2878 TaxID=1169474 RepID=A0A0G4HL32_9ALVE|eukprot:Cvel_28657.t1-p1 / transcript=Cvel_28657.t1 / gene=Cvel_28657 / organism=Chromera_velia_CCMP2878 / gene_product=hypothetical protein / transcript_product=hypothetical protein / location=Cvel_scaffold3793:2082-2645(+) / protein_length=188 / sequence_SO=supercontig / SO=protein_coding / is_pseudo=false
MICALGMTFAFGMIPAAVLAGAGAFCFAALVRVMADLAATTDTDFAFALGGGGPGLFASDAIAGERGESVGGTAEEWRDPFGLGVSWTFIPDEDEKEGWVTFAFAFAFTRGGFKLGECCSEGEALLDSQGGTRGAPPENPPPLSLSLGGPSRGGPTASNWTGSPSFQDRGQAEEEAEERRSLRQGKQK